MTEIIQYIVVGIIVLGFTCIAGFGAYKARQQQKAEEERKSPNRDEPRSK